MKLGMDIDLRRQILQPMYKKWTRYMVETQVGFSDEKDGYKRVQHGQRLP